MQEDEWTDEDEERLIEAFEEPLDEYPDEDFEGVPEHLFKRTAYDG